MRKILSICVCLALVLVGGLTFAACGKKDDTIKVKNEEQLVSAVKKGGKVKLTGDVELSKAVVISKKVTIDLNGHKITEKVTYTEADDDSTQTMFSLKKGADVTVKGEGTVQTDDLVIFWLRGESKTDTKLTISGGTYVGDDYPAVYLMKGSAYITGGTFEVETDTQYTLNIFDSDKADSQIVVTGGSFKGYDPAHSASEDPEVSFVKEGYVSVPETATEKLGYYTVMTAAEAAKLLPGGLGA